MQVKLRVIGGKNDGREIKIGASEFVIGRSEKAHLRPSSDLISRNHCALKIEVASLTIVDLDSRNGTFINGQQIHEPYVAKVGDTLRVGRLQFEVLIDHVQPAILSRPQPHTRIVASHRKHGKVFRFYRIQINDAIRQHHDVTPTRYGRIAASLGWCAFGPDPSNCSARRTD